MDLTVIWPTEEFDQIRQEVRKTQLSHRYIDIFISNVSLCLFMTERFPSRRITIREDQAAWIDNHPEISLSGLAQRAIDDYKVHFDIEQEMRSIKRSLEWDNGWNADLLNCPICRCSESPSSPIDFQHFEKPEYVEGLDDCKAWRGRGDLIRIPFWGECGHCWSLCIGFHKGNSFIFWEEGDHSKNPME